MNSAKYLITTPYGGWYEVAENGGVVRCNNGLDERGATDVQLLTWQIAGLRELRPFGNLGHLIPLSEAVKLDNFRFKNGKPRYTVEDLDHGTARIWGNTKCHGVYEVRFL